MPGSYIYKGRTVYDKEAFLAAEAWVARGCPAQRTVLTLRWQASYPLTFCRFWIKPDLRIVLKGKRVEDDEILDVDDFVGVDAHYDKTTEDFVAIGGFWINEMRGFEIKPQQEWNERAHYDDQIELYRVLRSFFPDTAPVKATLRAYEPVRSALRV